MSERRSASTGVNSGLLDLYERHVIDADLVQAIGTMPHRDRRLGAALWALAGALVEGAAHARTGVSRLFAALGIEGDLVAAGGSARDALYRRLRSRNRGRMPSLDELRADADYIWLTRARRELRAALRDRCVRERLEEVKPQERMTVRRLLRS